MNVDAILIGVPWLIVMVLVGFNLVFLYIWNQLYSMVLNTGDLVGDRTAHPCTLVIYEKVMEGGTFPAMRRLTVDSKGVENILSEVRRNPAFGFVEFLASWVKHMPLDFVHIMNSPREN